MANNGSAKKAHNSTAPCREKSRVERSLPWPKSTWGGHIIVTEAEMIALMIVTRATQTTERSPSPTAWPLENEEQLRVSTRKLLDLVERERVALVIFGHDGQQWQTLKKAPAFYE